MATEPTEHTGEAGGVECRWLEAESAAPVVYVHGVPDAGAMWRPLLDRTGGIAPDLPGFGASGKPADFDYSIPGYVAWLDAFLAERGVERCSLVCHDWGAVGLAFALAQPERIERLVLLDVVPFLPGYRWHTLARQWRRPGIGELAMGFTAKWILRRLMRLPDESPFPEAELDRIWRDFDHGTQRAILRLYRSAPEHVLEATGRRLDELRCPSLVVWGDADPYLPDHFAQDYAAALGGETTVDIVAGGGHWVLHSDPGVIDTVTSFLAD